ncbi:MAG TPA: family 20 glycosylhydrolase [Acidobacteriota bacterium]|nr:family 20 glycosylhydrolase [Acidobacteriota bacterium]
MSRRLRGSIPVLIALAVFLTSCAPKPASTVPAAKRPLILGMHALAETDADAKALTGEVPALAKRGVNLLICEVDYWYAYDSHPELRMENAIQKETVKALLAACRAHGIRLVPQFQSLGHQSWAEKTFPLLTKYPQLDETPNKYAGNKGTDPWGTEFYCRSWCPLHPELQPIINDLYDELLDVFEADALHIGMDEVFIIADADCPRCGGKPTGELFARAVNDAYDHIVRARGKEMMMWADRLLDGQATGYGLWEASMNGTNAAIDMIPKDIIMCDWHYEPKYPLQKTPKSMFPSPKIFVDKGFRVLPTSFRNVKALNRFIDQSLAVPSDKVLGHLCTVWHPLAKGQYGKLKQLKAASKKIKRASAAS